jgi:hypothetical protein
MAEDNIAAEALAAERLNTAIQLRVRGAHWSEIATRCGYSSPAAALKAVGAAMASATMRAEETADSMRDTANLRLEMLLGETLKMLAEDAPLRYDEDGNPDQDDDRAVKLRAVDEARRLVGDLAKLNGVDKPSKEATGGEVQTIRIVGVSPADLI